MSSEQPRLRVVVIDCPYDSWEDGQTASFFGKMVGLKLRGYKPEYAYGVMPVDTTDFLANHQLVCRIEDDGSMNPLLGFRSLTYDRCQLHNLPFAGISLCRAAGAPAQEKRVAEIVQSAVDRNRTIAYDSAYTIDPAIRQDRELTRTLREIFKGIYVLYRQDYGIHEQIAGGTIRFKTDQFFEYWGYRPLSTSDGELLPPIQVASLLRESVRVMHLETLTEKSITEAQPWKLMWKNRLTLSSPAQVRQHGISLKKAA